MTKKVLKLKVDAKIFQDQGPLSGQKITKLEQYLNLICNSSWLSNHLSNK